MTQRRATHETVRVENERRFDPTGDGRLLFEALDQHRIAEEPRTKHLDRDVAAKATVACTVHCTHGSTPE